MIVSFDLETTGTSTSESRIVQIAMVKTTDAFEETDRFEEKVYPGILIPEEATKVHGITDGDVRDCEAFVGIADEVLDFMKGCDLAGFNILGFDIPLLQTELGRCDKSLDLDGRRLLDAMVVFHHFMKRNLAGAMQYYCGAPHEDAHDALADSLAAVSVLKAQMERYEGLDSLGAVSELALNGRVTLDGKIIWDEDGEACLGFGKNEGVRLKHLEVSYMRWMLAKDFSKDTKRIILAAIDGDYPRRK